MFTSNHTYQFRKHDRQNSYKVIYIIDQIPVKISDKSGVGKQVKCFRLDDCVKAWSRWMWIYHVHIFGEYFFLFRRYCFW